MTQYIPKDTLVSEIENKRKYAQAIGDIAINSSMQQFFDGMKQGCVDILSFLDTLETKEVDLERLINDYFTGWYFDNELDILAKPNNYSATIDDVKEIAKYFFKLGMAVSNKVQKGEEV